VTALSGAIQAAEEATVNEKLVKKGKNFLGFMEYIKEFESFI
jgi:hypothetical protein